MKKDISKLNDDEVEKLSHHNLSVKKIMEFANPFNGCWPELESPITIEEVKQCIINKKEELIDTPSWYDIAFKKVLFTPEEIRERHIKKIAFFAVNESENPISIDVGIPEMGCFVSYIVDDGNHRLAGAIVGEKETLKASVSGCMNHAKELELWNPNEYWTESYNRFMKKHLKEEDEKPKKVPKMKL